MGEDPRRGRTRTPPPISWQGGDRSRGHQTDRRLHLGSTGYSTVSRRRSEMIPASMLAKPTPPQLFRIAHHTRVAVNCVMKTSKRTNERRLRPTSSIGLIGKSLLLSLPSQRPEPLPIAADATSSFVWLIDYRVPRRPFMQSRYYAPAAAASHCPIHPILYSAERTSRPTMDQSKKEEGKRWRRIFVRLAGG